MTHLMVGYKIFGVLFIITGICGQELKWWEAGVIYEAYPRSFKDSDGDGVGDLKGIEEKIDYLESLGVSGVWLPPINKSPGADFGYDVSDFRTVDPMFGDIDDLKSLLNKLNERGIKLMVDFVPNHTSDEHEWFQKSVNNTPPYSDYYVWREPKGWKDFKPIPPNNWLSLMGGSAWEYVEKRNKFYLHQFSKKQPDLNFRNPIVCKEMKDVLRYWLDFGIDGFRVDAVAELVEHPDFLDEPILPGAVDDKPGINSFYKYQHDQYTRDRPENLEIVEMFADVVHEYNTPEKQRFIITEVWSDIENTKKYYGNETKKIADMSFNFLMVRRNTISMSPNASEFSYIINLWLDGMTGLQGNWLVGSHDVRRVASKHGKELAETMIMIICSLPGTVFTYNGEELGMENTFIRWDQTVDPRGTFDGPNGYTAYSRDPLRTPFQWDTSVSAGFSTNPDTWLPVNPNYWWLNVEAQEAADRSHLKVYRRMVKLKSVKTMQLGSYKTHILSPWVLAITRKLEGHESYYLVANLGSELEVISLQMRIKNLPRKLYVHTCSVNSEHEIGDIIDTGAYRFYMRPKSALVLTDKILRKSKSDENYEQPILMKIFNYVYDYLTKDQNGSSFNHKNNF